MAMYNTNNSITDFAHSSFKYALNKGLALYLRFIMSIGCWRGSLKSLYLARKTQFWKITTGLSRTFSNMFTMSKCYFCQLCTIHYGLHDCEPKVIVRGHWSWMFAYYDVDRLDITRPCSRLKVFGMSTVWSMIWWLLRWNPRAVSFGRARIMMGTCRVIQWRRVNTCVVA